MIEASVGALPGLIPAFLIISAIVGVPSALMARAKGRPVGLLLLFVVALAGVLTVTLMPGNGGSGQVGICDVGLPLQDLLSSESARLNVLLFIPASFLAVLLFRRPVSALSGSLILTCGVELIQSWIDLGRSCSYDDVKANALGGFLGVFLGTVVLWLWKRRSPFTRFDAIWGVCAGVLGGLLLAASFAFTVEPVNSEEKSKQRRESLKDDLAQDSWLQQTVDDLYGKGTTITQSASLKMKNGHWRLEAETAKGNVVAKWPERKLVRFALKGGASGGGTLSEAEIQSIGDQFARKWFADEVAGAKATHRVVHGNQGPHILVYRRYVDGVMMPMRLDLTVSPAGRITAMAANSAQDPKLPKAVVTRANAEGLAARTAEGATAVPANLLAQRVNHAWRPVWMVSIMRGAKQTPESTVFIDAVTGKEVTPEAPSEDG
ncbi:MULTISPECIES: VanZ family protein [Streptomyces]|uniref:VanZ like family protein n=1 Tax=Streptomyces yunnanensis TaxID=156453 RepID=A0A9X8MU73_9ACTN|nr:MULTISPECIES: VanZ family protein [Streptomyces]SHL82671.1 VanZ like family protein [Streptomyces yunnanensis]